MGIAVIVAGADYSSAGLGKVTLVEDVALQGLVINGDSSIVGTEAEFSVSYIPSNTSHRGVIWSVESGSDYASIDASSGVLTVLQGANFSEVVIRATSIKDTTVFATKALNVTYTGSLVEKSALVFDGNSAIDTGIPVNDTYKYELDFTLNMSDANGHQGSNYYSTVIGGRTSTSANRRDVQMILLNNSFGSIFVDFAFGAGTGGQTAKKYGNGRRTLVSAKTGFSYGEETVANSRSSSIFSTDIHVVLGAQNTNGDIVYAYASRDTIHAFRIYDGSDVLLRDFVPCLYQGVPGMWDKVTQSFFGNVGSGTLIAE